MKKLSVISRALSKIQHKRYELYVISRIIHKLDDPGIQYNFQQYAYRKNEKYALIDLYLPQFNIAIEVDEGYHLGQLTADEIRQKEIQTLQEDNLFFERVNCSSTQGIDAVNKRIDEIVVGVTAKKNKLKEKGVYAEWDGKSGYEHYISKRKFEIGDRTELSSPTEICNCFGLENATQGGSRWWRNPSDKQLYLLVWAKENYEGSNGKVVGTWYNKKCNENGKIVVKEAKITSPEDSQKHFDTLSKDGNKNKNRVLFYAKRNMLNERLYTFEGVFKLEGNEKQEINGQEYTVCKWVQQDKGAEIVLPTLEDYQKVVSEMQVLPSDDDLLKVLPSDDDLLKELKGVYNKDYKDLCPKVGESLASLQMEWANYKTLKSETIEHLSDLLQGCSDKPKEKHPLKTLINSVEKIREKVPNLKDKANNYDGLCYDLTQRILSLSDDWAVRCVSLLAESGKELECKILKKHIALLCKIDRANGNVDEYIEKEMLSEWRQLKEIRLMDSLHEKFANQKK